MLDMQNSREVSRIAEEPVPEQRQRLEQEQDPEEPEGQKALAGTDCVSHSEEYLFVKAPSICHQLFQVLLIGFLGPRYQDIWGPCLSFAEVQRQS